MRSKPRIVDAEFEVVSGPYRVGDEHRERRGWYLTDKVGRRGEPLWYKPPGWFSRGVRIVGITIWLGSIALGVLVVFLAEILPELLARWGH